MRRIIIFMAILAACAGNLNAQVYVRLTVTGFRGNEGSLLLAVYDDGSQFPYEPSIEYFWPKDTLTGEKMVVDFDLPVAGEYSFSILDDTDGDGKMDKNFIGLPQERFGFSNDAGPVLFSPPDYADCVVKMAAGTNDMSISLQRF